MIDPFPDLCRCRPREGRICNSCLSARRAKAAARIHSPGDGHSATTAVPGSQLAVGSVPAAQEKKETRERKQK
jgi:hypothetical protein